MLSFTHVSKKPNESASCKAKFMLFIYVERCLTEIESNGGKLVLNLIIQFWSVSKSDIMPNWYVAGPDLEAVLIKSTTDDAPSFRSDFKTQDQYQRYRGDQYHPFTAEKRYER